MIDTLMPLIKQFLPFAGEKMGFKNPPRLFLRGDSKNASNPLGKTAQYDPSAKSVTLYITGRHPKDVMRSLSHELVHHTQNCRGDFDDVGEMGEGYAQNDVHLREMEREAYEVGNMCFRDWEDSIKSTIYFEHLQKGEKKMSIKDWKNKEISTLLSEAWGFKFSSLQEFDEFNGTGEIQEDRTGGQFGGDVVQALSDADPDVSEKESKVKELNKREEEGLDETHDPDWGMGEKEKSRTKPGEEDYTTKKGKKKKTTSPGRGEKKGDEADVNESAEITEDSGEEEGEHYEDNAMHDEDHIKAIEHHLDALKHDRDYDDEHIDERASMEDAHPQGPGRRTTKTSGERVTSENIQVSKELRNAILEVLRKHF